MDLRDYVSAHTGRGECQCGKCIDRGNTPEPKGHTADMVFFKVMGVGHPSAEEFIRLTKEHEGEYGDVDPMDGGEHNYIELGAWIGDQGLAMRYMALGNLLGVFDLLTPRMLKLDDATALAMACKGFLSVQKKRVA